MRDPIREKTALHVRSPLSVAIVNMITGKAQIIKRFLQNVKKRERFCEMLDYPIHI